MGEAPNTEHDWHLFDTEHGYEVRALADGSYEIRDQTGTVTPLTPDEFDRLRSEGPNPAGL